MTSSIITNKDTRHGRRKRLAHKHYVTLPPHTTITFLDYCVKTKNCRKEKRL